MAKAMGLPGMNVALFLASCGCIVTATHQSVVSTKTNDIQVVPQTDSPYSVIRSGKVAPTIPPYCPVTKGVGLNWTKSMGDTEFVYQDSFKQLWCCATGYKKITWSWSKNPDDTKPWQDIKSGPGVVLGFDQQQLVIKQFNKSDAGFYRCTAEDLEGKAAISHQYRVVVEERAKCDRKAKPVFGKPLQNDSFYSAQIGGNMTITCLVSFGKTCGFFVDRLNNVKWFKVVNGSCDQSISYQTNEKQERYYTERYVKSRDLEIMNISKSDIGDQWCCKASKNTKASRVIMFVGLAKIDPTTVVKEEPFSIKLILSVLVSAIAVTIIVLVVLWYYRLDILLLRHAKCGKRANFDDIAPNQECYDIILVHSAGDNRFVADVLHYELERNRGYRVFLPRRDLQLGYIDAAWIAALRLRPEQKLVVLISECFLKDPLCGSVHNYIINEQRNEDIIYIEYHHIAKESWQPTTTFANRDVLHKSVKNAGRSWLGLGRRLRWRDGFDVQTDGRVQLNEAKTRKIGKFWKQLGLYLPPQNNRNDPHHHDHERRPPRPREVLV